MNEQEMIDVITAHMKGTPVEAKRKKGQDRSWAFAGWAGPVWNFDEFDYRVLVTPEDIIKEKDELLEECLYELKEWQRYHLVTYDEPDDETSKLINKLNKHLNK